MQCSNRSILSRKHVVAGVLMLKSVVHRPSSDKCCGWYCWPASHNVAICGSHRGDAAYFDRTNKLKKYFKFYWTFKILQICHLKFEKKNNWWIQHYYSIFTEFYYLEKKNCTKINKSWKYDWNVLTLWLVEMSIVMFPIQC